MNINIFTVQNKEVFLELNKNGVVYPLPISPEDKDFYPSYCWMYKMMKKRKVPLNKGDGGIFWGHLKKDEMVYYEGVFLELEVPYKDVLVNDFMGWHNVLNNYPFYATEEEEIMWDAKNNKTKKYHKEKEKSWEHIFEVTYENNEIVLSDYLKSFYGNCSEILQQVCFTKIEMSWVKSVDVMHKCLKFDENLLEYV
jgi:hypothetical protein